MSFQNPLTPEGIGTHVLCQLTLRSKGSAVLLPHSVCSVQLVDFVSILAATVILGNIVSTLVFKVHGLTRCQCFNCHHGHVVLRACAAC